MILIQQVANEQDEEGEERRRGDILHDALC